MVLIQLLLIFYQLRVSVGQAAESCNIADLLQSTYALPTELTRWRFEIVKCYSSTQQRTLTVLFLLVFICPLKLSFCTSIKDGSELRTIKEIDEDESIPTTSNSSQVLRDQCYNGNIEETINALGVLKLPGVRLVRVEGYLYNSLLENDIVVRPGSTSANSYNSKEKRSSIEMCEEEFDFTYTLAHASSQLAYKVDTVKCKTSYCQSPGIKHALGDIEFGDCVLKEKSMIVYIINSSNEFVPKTIDIGCACKCSAYF